MRRVEVRHLPMPRVPVGTGAMQQEQQLAAVQRWRHTGQRRTATVKIVERQSLDGGILREHACSRLHTRSASVSSRPIDTLRCDGARHRRTAMAPLRIGLIGAGLIGGAHSAVLRTIADAMPDSIELTAVADPLAEHRELFARLYGYRDTFADG